MAARTASLAAEGGVEAVAAEVSVPEGGERQGEARGAPSEARDHGDAAHPEGEAHAQQNGNGRPVADTALHKERVERPARESEPTYAVPVSERPVRRPRSRSKARPRKTARRLAAAGGSASALSQLLMREAASRMAACGPA